MTKDPSDLRRWSVRDSRELYNVGAWGGGYFEVNDRGHVVVRPEGASGPEIDLYDVVHERLGDVCELPVLLRFSDVLERRAHELIGAFDAATGEYGYRGSYRPVYPIKVNQQRDVVEQLATGSSRLGLEAGSKPELLIALAHMESPDGLIVCNGFKDHGYIETALLAQKLGRHPIIVIDRFDELETVLAVSGALELRPHIGVRARLAAKGVGKWVESSGERSKFGLTADELVRVVERLDEVEMLDCLELLHFHIGSQITAIRAVKDALREATKIYVELWDLGASGLRFLDVGGGLGVDYDGSKTNFHSSTNYTLQEYANDVVWSIQEACDQREIPHPDIVSESGRALVAHHALLVFDVLGAHGAPVDTPDPEWANHESRPIRELFDTWATLSPKNFQESYHDVLGFRDEALNLFQLGYLRLRDRAIVEKLFWAICRRIRSIVEQLEYVPEELSGLERALAKTYYCNFSVFQSAPDHWAVKQLFPVLPLHRLDEEPTERGVLADLTCDSDGKVDRFIDLNDVKRALELHELRPGEPYYLGIFLVGAYQEILGDLHNLFGDTHVVHIRLDRAGGYRIERAVAGESVEEVLDYVQYAPSALLDRVRSVARRAIERGDLRADEAALLERRYEEALTGYTYLSRRDVVDGLAASPAVTEPVADAAPPPPVTPA